MTASVTASVTLSCSLLRMAATRGSTVVWDTAHPLMSPLGCATARPRMKMMGGTVGVGVACLRTVVNRVNAL